MSLDGIPWAEMIYGLALGLVLARTQHLFRVIHRAGYKSHCAWCRGHLVDLRRPGAQEAMRSHVVACAARPAVQP